MTVHHEKQKLQTHHTTNKQTNNSERRQQQAPPPPLTAFSAYKSGREAGRAASQIIVFQQYKRYHIVLWLICVVYLIQHLTLLVDTVMPYTHAFQNIKHLPGTLGILRRICLKERTFARSLPTSATHRTLGTNPRVSRPTQKPHKSFKLQSTRSTAAASADFVASNR